MDERRHWQMGRPDGAQLMENDLAVLVFVLVLGMLDGWFGAKE